MKVVHVRYDAVIFKLIFMTSDRPQNGSLV
jgi:hypothetical protein